MRDIYFQSPFSFYSTLINVTSANPDVSLSLLRFLAEYIGYINLLITKERKRKKEIRMREEYDCEKKYIETRR